ncbi:MAG: hypothetical protein M3Y57_20440, partial [Acidobacteriota bacterium]|nr:hypothetical protein [Acidobacteriota bacterium]
DSKKEDNADDLYAWSEVRDQYEAASSFASARTAYASSFNGGLGNNGYTGNGYYGGNGFGSGYGPGWAWNAGFNSWGWLPADGAFFSPFGYGFFAPGVVAYAPVAYLPGGGGGRTIAVPVNPQKPPVIAGLPGNSAGVRPSRPAIYTTTGAAYRSGPVVMGGAPATHVSGSSIAGAARASYSGGPSAGSSRSSAGSGGYRGGGASSAPSGNMSRGGGMSGGGGMSHGPSGGAARR